MVLMGGFIEQMGQLLLSWEDSTESSSPKSQTRGEISCRTTAAGDLYQSSSPSSLTVADEGLELEAKMAKERIDKWLKEKTDREISWQKNAETEWKESIDLYLSSSPLGNNPNLTDEERHELRVKVSQERIDKWLQTDGEIDFLENLVTGWKETIFGGGRFNWIPMKGKTSEQEKCGVCLEELRNGRSLDHRLPCGHKFHSYCLRSGLPENPTCPNCRPSTSHKYSLQHLKID